MSNRAVFLDRDGVINRKPSEGEYVTRWEELHFLPGTVESITLLNRAGFRVVVVTNQRCIAKRIVTSHTLDSMHRQMCQWFEAAGARIDGVYYCPHDNKPQCTCRKPAPGMLLLAARTHDIDLSASWMVGDSDIDVDAGRNAGCRTVRLLNGGETATGGVDVVAPSLLEAVRQILRRDGIRHVSATPVVRALGDGLVIR